MIAFGKVNSSFIDRLLLLARRSTGSQRKLMPNEKPTPSTAHGSCAGCPEAALSAPDVFSPPLVPQLFELHAVEAVATEQPALFGHAGGNEGWRWGLGLQMDVLPVRTVESEGRQLPMVRADLRWAHPSGFYGSGRLRAVLVSNTAELGAGYALRSGKFSIAAHDHLGYFYGIVGFSGLDAVSMSWMHTPGATVSYRFGEDVVSFCAEAVLTFKQSARIGSGVSVVSESNSGARNAYVGTLTVEHTLKRGGSVYGGAALIYSSPDYQAWLAFSDERARTFYPRLFGGYAF